MIPHIPYFSMPFAPANSFSTFIFHFFHFIDLFTVYIINPHTGTRKQINDLNNIEKNIRVSTLNSFETKILLALEPTLNNGLKFVAQQNQDACMPHICFVMLLDWVSATEQQLQ